MITQVRRISLLVAFVVAVVSAWSTAADAMPSQRTVGANTAAVMDPVSR